MLTRHHTPTATTMTTTLATAACIAMSLSLGSRALGVDRTFVNSNGYYNSPAAWIPSGVPSTSDGTEFYSTSAIPTSVTILQPRTCRRATFQRGAFDLSISNYEWTTNQITQLGQLGWANLAIKSGTMSTPSLRIYDGQLTVDAGAQMRIADTFSAYGNTLQTSQIHGSLEVGAITLGTDSGPGASITVTGSLHATGPDSVFLGGESSSSINVFNGGDVEIDPLTSVFPGSQLYVAGPGRLTLDELELNGGKAIASNGGVGESATTAIGIANLGSILAVESGGAWTVTDDLFISGYTTHPSREAAVEVREGGSMSVAGTTTVWSPGLLDVDESFITGSLDVSSGTVEQTGKLDVGNGSNTLATGMAVGDMDGALALIYSGHLNTTDAHIAMDTAESGEVNVQHSGVWQNQDHIEIGSAEATSGRLTIHNSTVESPTVTNGPNGVVELYNAALAGDLFENQGLLTGAGSITSRTINAGDITPDKIFEFTHPDGLTLTSASTLAIEIPTPNLDDRDRIIADGPIVLGGALDLHFDFEPALNVIYEIVRSNTPDGISGTFGSIRSNYSLRMYYDPDVVYVQYRPCAGDVNGSGHVGFDDIADLLTNWGMCPSDGDCPWDLDDSGHVGFDDLADVLINWGSCG